MKEYRVEIRIKNNMLYKEIIENYGTIVGFCRKTGFTYSCLSKYLNMHGHTIYGRNNKLLPNVEKLCKLLNKSPGELFPEQYYLPKNTAVIEANKEEMVSLTYCQEALAIANETDAMDEIMQNDLKRTLNHVLATLSPREEYIIRALSDGMSRTELSEYYKVSKTRIAQIEQKALKKLRHGTRAKQLKPYLHN